LPCLLLLISLVDGQVRTPDRFVSAGVTFAMNQEMLDTFKTINVEIFKELDTTMTNLHIDRLLSLKVPVPSSINETVELMHWSISGLNITNVSFDANQSIYMLIEPT
jgi:hypothetical protein